MSSKNGCRAGLDLELTEGSKGNCFISIDQHSNHKEAIKKYQKIDENDPVTQKIWELDNLNLNPESIRHNLIKLGLNPPKASRFNYLLTINRSKKRETSHPTMRNFKDWCEQNTSIPDEDDTVFVGHFEYKAFPNQFFRVFLTTKRLVKFSLEAKFILSDATYKLTYGNFPALTGGTTDRAKKFHPFGLALCNSEKEIDFAFFFKSIKQVAEQVYNKTIDPRIIIADNAEAIANGFEQVFVCEKRINCWAHVIRKIDGRLNVFEDEFKKKIRADIFKIQTLSSELLFQDAVKLFDLKYRRYKNETLNSFLKYFDDEWIKKHPGWYEGYAIGMPSTTNGLESSHEKIKKALQQKRLGLIEFLNECKNNLIHFWSQDRSSSIIVKDPDTEEFIEVDNLNCKEFYNAPIITEKDLKLAYDWNKRDKRIVHYQGSYYIKSGKEEDKEDKPTKETIKQHLQALNNQGWTTFDEMMQCIYSFHKVSINRENWKLSTCSCSFWLKHYKCNHVISCSFRLQLLDFNSIGLDLPIHNNKKRGAPAKTLKSLQIQPSDLREPEENVIYDDEETAPGPSNKRQKTTDSASKLCETCGKPLQKKLYFFCPINKCKQKKSN